MDPGVTRDNRGSSRTLIQQVTGRLASSTGQRSVAYNDEVTLDLLVLEDREVLVFHIRDGKVVEVWQYFENQYSYDEFFS